MKKKVQQKKQIVAAFTPGIFWQHKAYSPEQLIQVDTFLTNFDKELKAILVEPTFEANYKLLCDKIGLSPHPSLDERKKVSEFKNLGEEGYGEKFVIFLNHKVDSVTLKLLGFLLGVVKVNTLKFSNNSLTEDELKCLITLLGKEDTASTLFFEWNPVAAFPAPLPQNLITSLVRPCFTSLILRSNNLGDSLIKQLLPKILPDSKLRYLDLYDNNITGESIPAFTKLLEQNKSIEYLGLSKNSISEVTDLEALFGAIGNVRLSPEELTAYRKLEKERDQILEKNKKKKKGQPDQPVPFLLKIQEIEGDWYYVKNQKLKGITLGWNRLKGPTSEIIRAFLQRVNADKQIANQFQLVLSGNEFGMAGNENLRDLPGVKI